MTGYFDSKNSGTKNLKYPPKRRGLKYCYEFPQFFNSGKENEIVMAALHRANGRNPHLSGEEN